MGLLSVLPKALNYAKRAIKLAPEALLGTGSEVIGQGMRAAGKGTSIWTKVKAGGKALEKDVAKKALKGGFFKRTFKDLVNLPKSIIRGSKVGARAAKIAGKSSTKGALKGAFKAIGKKMPMIGAVLTLAFEAPSIFKAFKNDGVGAGLKEIGGASVELGSMAAGAAIGSAICPGIGTIIGGIVGQIAGSCIRGKTYSEKEDEVKQLGVTDDDFKQLRDQGYSIDDISKLANDTYDQTLHSYGLSDDEIKQLKDAGYSIEDVEKMLAQEIEDFQQLQQQERQQIEPQDNTRVQQPYIDQPVEQNTQVNTNEQDTQVQTNEQEAQAQQFQMPEFKFESPYTMPTYTTPNLFNNTYNMNSFNNPYSNDFYYQQAFSESNGSNDNIGFTNPFTALYPNQNQYFRYQA